LLALVLAACGSGGGKKKASVLTPEQVFAQSKPGVVQITGKVPGKKGRQGFGTGFVIDAQQGLVLTAQHVVGGGSRLKARVAQNQILPIRILAQAPCDDLAIAKLASVPPGIKALPLGNSSTVKPGQTLIALGYPRSGGGGTTSVVSNTGTVSVSNISAAPDPSYPTYRSLIRHQVPINPGNSGGPLLNNHGQVVGVNVLGNTGAQNDNYAIAMNYAKTLLPDLKAGKSHDYVGWTLETTSQANLAKQFYINSPFNVKDSLLAARIVRKQNGYRRALFVDNVDSGSPADNHGISFGSVITDIDGDSVTKVSDVCDAFQNHAPGEKVKVTGEYFIDYPSPDRIGDLWTERVKLK
jgi:S1-C subfamily serine protease